MNHEWTRDELALAKVCKLQIERASGRRVRVFFVYLEGTLWTVYSVVYSNDDFVWTHKDDVLKLLKATARLCLDTRLKATIDTGRQIVEAMSI